MKIKRFFAISLLIISIMATLTACGARGRCDLCREEGRLQTITVYGLRANACRDCRSER